VRSQTCFVWGIRFFRADDARSKTEVDSFVFAGNESVTNSLTSFVIVVMSGDCEIA